MWVGDREITDIVDTRTIVRENAQADAINTGRYI